MSAKMHATTVPKTSPNNASKTPSFPSLYELHIIRRTTTSSSARIEATTQNEPTRSIGSRATVVSIVSGFSSSLIYPRNERSYSLQHCLLGSPRGVFGGTRSLSTLANSLNIAAVKLITILARLWNQPLNRLRLRRPLHSNRQLRPLLLQLSLLKKEEASLGVGPRNCFLRHRLLPGRSRICTISELLLQSTRLLVPVAIP